MAAGKLDFELVTPYRRVHHLDADEVVCPGVEGEFGILPGHAPLLANLKPGRQGGRQGEPRGGVRAAGVLPLRPVNRK
jgi:F-type H+-transporting ATPase subunit epsilon